MQVTGGFHDAEDLRRVNFVVDGRIFRLSDIATVRRGYADPPQPHVPLQRQYRPSGWASPCAAAATCSLWAATSSAVMRTVTAALPVGIEPHLVAAQPQVVRAGGQ